MLLHYLGLAFWPTGQCLDLGWPVADRWQDTVVPGIPVVRGLLWGGILFVIAQLVFVPIFLRGGVLGLKHHRMAWATALLVHGVYGAIVGWLCPIVA